MIFSHSHFLQSLGWATMNSFWQMAALWVLFVLANFLFTFSPRVKYMLTTGSIIFGFVWSIVTFCQFYSNSSRVFPGFSSFQLAQDYLPILNYVSIAYLLVLIIPVYKLFLSWRFLKVLREQQLGKPDITYRLFVQKMSVHLEIKRKISLFVSSLVESPVTIGYLKPIILLPLASANHLSTQQVEAILLHELVHIKRYDYILNLIISTIHTLLYFNPFVRLFSWVVEEERENCCDAGVLQFGYDKMSYATALLELEKVSVQSPVFALRAIGKKNLRSRIEKIVGVKRVPVLRFRNLGSFTVAILLIVGLNFVAVKTRKNDVVGLSFNNWVNPFYFFHEEGLKKPVVAQPTNLAVSRINLKPIRNTKLASPELPAASGPVFPVFNPFAVQASFSQKTNFFERNTQVEKTVEATKIVLETLQWKEIERSIGDGLTDDEKLQVKEEYLNRLDRIDWNDLQTNLIEGYDHINWQRLNLDLKALLSVAGQDSLYYHSFLPDTNASDCTETAPVIAINDSSCTELTLQVSKSPHTLTKPIKKHRARQPKISL